MNQATSAAQPWTDEQPKDGDVVLLCPHKSTENYHVFKLIDADGGPAQLTRSDRARFRAGWLMICETCYVDTLRTGSKPDSKATRDMVWRGDEPSVRRPAVQ